MKEIGNFRINLTLLAKFELVRFQMTDAEVNRMRQRNKALKVRDACLPPKFKIYTNVK